MQHTYCVACNFGSQNFCHETAGDKILAVELFPHACAMHTHVARDHIENLLSTVKTRE